MPEAKSNATRLLESADQDAGHQLGRQETPPDCGIDEMSEDELREHLRRRGFEVRRTPKSKGVVAKADDDVQGKIRVGIHLTKNLRMALKQASDATNQSQSLIAEEALQAWMEANNLRT